MPLENATGSKQETERNFDDVRHGKTFRRTERRYGKKRARKQMVAIVLRNKREAARKKTKRKRG